ncbi:MULTISPECIES: CD3337/EF1877 family mobilome membrane protein [unclassified Bacillus cereus group]|uniref:CD3337/EF1877 family mobilome membrane protein n=1 Tax=unclassified Bacillus cereus group TaxID=2750818 RepID=UPI0022E049A2|nr:MULTISPECIES: CPBP family intramembrane metalloprotease [unclassified Bacillus cereus group]MDA2666996.1 CPBP family intramembrane metalloprotease [Bacillus cereus group sp. Bc032]MDA2677700.1 CPBP family intramembrane metalloprotease [Bacillus cereus group sp. Bc031]MDA2683205.1 CPBP family intramembrane metalloprotease [Bacillus cereus group sp. Bc029]MDA2688643.1 CPBP family intramembrane metalloprotease [Bacillus cereus group sp. Bc030]MDA2744177.1 CPBP family intramembrane metalloprote
MKKLFSICMILVFFLLPLGPHVALAEDTKTEEKQEQKGARISENLFSGYTDGIYKGKYYEIDTYQPKEDEKNVFQKVGGYLFGDDSVGKDLQRMLYTTCQWLANMAFQLNVILGQLTIFLVDQALNLDIVDTVADKLGAAMQNIAGIGKGGFLSSGLFPAIIGIACVLSACYAGYIFFIKRQPSKGLSELVKTVFVIAFIVTYIGNAGTILKSANTISSEISVTVLAKATGTVAGDPGRSKADAIFSVKKQIWDLLVERPYLFLQYGEDSKEKLGAQRVDELLAKSPGKERNEAVEKEVKKGNQMMVISSVGERLVFTVMYYVVNTFAGVPVIAFCLLIVAFQLWFLVMSIISPIVMAVALLPGHRRVIESWASQWIRPLALKIFMSVMLVIIFTVAELLYVLPEAGVAGYVSTMIFQILVFVLCYLFRGNIVAAFSRARGVYETVTNISLMTENFVDKGKEYAGNTMSYIGDKMGMHFNNAAELAAAGGQLENAGTDDEKTKANPLVQANIPNDLPNNQTEQEKEENQKKGKLISLQDRDKQGNLPQQEEEGEKQTVPGEEEAPMQQDLISLDKEALEHEVEGQQEGTEVEESEMDVQPELVSLENEEIPTGEEIPADIEGYEELQPEVPEQEVPLEDIPTDIEVYEEVQPEVPEQEVPLEDVSTDMEAYEEIQTEVPEQEIPLEEVSNDMEAYEEIQTEVPTQELPLEEVSTDHEAHEEIPSDIPQQDIPTEEIPMDISREEIQPEQETSTHLPQQEISTPIETEANEPLIPDTIRADVNEEGVIVPHTPETTSADIPDAIPAEVTEAGEIVAKKSDIDVESTAQVTNSSDAFIPTESSSSSDLTRVNEKEVSKNEPIQGEAETIDTPDMQYGAVAAGSENWMPSTDPQNLDNLDGLEPPKKDE